MLVARYDFQVRRMKEASVMIIEKGEFIVSETAQKPPYRLHSL